MKQKKALLGAIPLILLCMTQCNSKNNYPEGLDNLVTGSSLIFKGKILVLHTVTTDEDDVSNTGVVIITDLIDAPQSFQGIGGQEVTVRFSDINKVNVSEERLFFTEPYWVGESLGVTEKGSVLKGDKLYESKDISSYIQQARAKQGDEQLRKILKDAKLVVLGKVIKISTPKGYKRMATEHDPEWKEAELQIEEIIKGKTEGKTVKILFASSTDVMFFESPKFKEGDEGIFITQPTDSSTAKLLRNEYMVLEPSRYLKGKDRVKKVKSLLR